MLITIICDGWGILYMEGIKLSGMERIKLKKRN